MQPLVLPAQTPVALELSPVSSGPPLMVQAPGTSLPAVPVVEEEPTLPRAKRQHPHQAQTASGGTQPATAGAGPSADAATEDGATTAPTDIGVFSVGGEQNPRSQHDAEGLIASNDRRLNGLTPPTARAQASLVSKVRTFQRDAVQALTSGDAEGAKTLATKGKLMLDDLERGIPSQ